MAHSWYYDLTPDKKHGTDDTGCLVWLCEQCARDLRLDVEFASTDADRDAPCDQCNASVGD